MFLTLKLKFHNPSMRKTTILQATVANFSMVMADILRKAKRRYNELPFLYPALDKDKKPIYQKDRKTGEAVLENDQPVPLMRRSDGNYLAVSLCSNLDSPFRAQMSSTLWYDACKKAAGSLLSNWELSKMAQAGDTSLTSTKVEFPSVDVDFERHRQEFEAELDYLASPACLLNAEEANQRLRCLPLWQRYLPLSFAGTQSFDLLVNQKTGQIYLLLKLLSAEHPKATRSVKQKGRQPNLVSLISGKPVPNSKISLLFPLECGREQEAQLKAVGMPLSNAERFFRGSEGKRKKLEVELARKFTPKTGEIFERKGEWFFTVTGEVTVSNPENPVAEAAPQAFVGVFPTMERITCAVVGIDGKVLEELVLPLTEYNAVVRESGKLMAKLRRRNKVHRMPKYGRQLEDLTHNLVNKIIALATRHRAAIACAQIAGLNKSTWAGGLNRRRSHFDFGRLETMLGYKPIVAGVPQVMVRRGRKEELFTVYDGVALFTCSGCGESNTGKTKGDKKISVTNHRFRCGVCHHEGQAGLNAAVVVGKKYAEWVQKPKGKKPH